MAETGGNGKCYEVGAYRVEPEARRLYRDTRPLDVNWRCVEALAILIEADGRVVDRSVFFDRIWPGVTVEESSLTKVVSELRKVLASEDTGTEYIETVPRLGYRMALPATPIGRESSPSGAPPLAPAAASRRRTWFLAGAAAMAAVVVLLALQPRGAGEAPRAAEALAAYKKGRSLLQTQDYSARKQAAVHFREAVELDPDFALAHAGLARALLDSRSAEMTVIAARRAVELDPRCGECLAILGFIEETVLWEWESARTHLRQAVEYDPDNGWIRDWNAHNLAVSGQLAEALAEADRAIRLSGYDAGPHTTKAVILYLMRRYADSIATADEAIGLDYNSGGAWEFRARSLLQLGRHREAFEAMFRSQKVWEKHREAVLPMLERDGFEPTLRWFIDANAATARRGNAPFHRATWFTLLGETQNALAELEAGLETRRFNMVYVAVDPAFEPLHDDPRFIELLSRLQAGPQSPAEQE